MEGLQWQQHLTRTTPPRPFFPCMQYHYLNQSGVTTVENINDEKDYEELINAMDVLNMSRTERDDILTLVSAILHLGTHGPKTYNPRAHAARWAVSASRLCVRRLPPCPSPPTACPPGREPVWDVHRVLCVGDVEFDTNTSSTGDDGSKIKNMAVLTLAANQLRVGTRVHRHWVPGDTVHALVWELVVAAAVA